ncbi:hypothetical protein M885DRAFT_590852 [Pelagophyceae sp. CCMP2097]|nr:hypothetical protein M885DRAFT_590852 [Pelagophyceae sp. CCMP2097]|mmetsp:Transcript_8726/g.28689  ORF Transcript_8726/g.28689 Transcript_8726/m.28689 type:complete len:245 (-) Transcript_8726:49-783(-)
MEGLSERAQGVLGEMDWPVVFRGVEFGFSLLTWTIIASASQPKYGGYFQYDNYTPLNFLLAVAILQWLYIIVLKVVFHSKSLDPESYAKLELWGTAFCAATMYTGAIAGAASATQLHDQFGSYDTSVCIPRPNASSGEKDKAKFFCRHVDSACVFAFFSAIAAASSLRAVVQARKGDGAGDGGAHSSAYNPIGADSPTIHGDAFAGNFAAGNFSGGNGPNFHGGAKMEGMGSDRHMEDNSAVDL